MSLPWPDTVNERKNGGLATEKSHLHCGTGGPQTQGSRKREKSWIQFYSLLRICLLDLLPEQMPQTI